MGSREMKYERTVNAADAADFFRALANSVENDSLELDNYGIDLNAAKKVKLSVKIEGSQFTLKIKAKYPDRADTGEVVQSPPLGSGRAPYKYLKKRMKATFKAIGNGILAGQSPKETDIAQFLDDSELMVTYPGRGDEFYESYTTACREFSNAFEKGDIAAMQECYNHLSQLKGDCHSRYK